VKEGTFGIGGPCGNPSARTQLFAVDSQTSRGSKKEETLRRPVEAPEETERGTRPPEVFNILTGVFNILTEVFIVPL